MRAPRLAMATLALAASCAGAMGQSPPSPPPTLQQSPLPGTPAPAPVVPPTAGRQTLITEPGDPGNVDEVNLPSRPALVMAGSGQWEDAYKALRDAFGKIEAELARQGIVPTGRPIASFTQTTDDAFKFDAMIPVAALPSPPPTLPAGMRFGETPGGRAYRFVHKGSYEDIDTTYDTVTTYLEAKDIAAKDVFMEEFVNDVRDGTDVNLEVNIFVQPK